MVIVSPQDLGLRDPFQMVELHGLYIGGDPYHWTNWDDRGDPPSCCTAER